MNRIILIPVVLGMAIVSACSASKTAKAKSKKEVAFKKTESGIEYKMLHDVEGTNAKEGDYVELHIRTLYNNDSLIFNSREQNGGNPVKFPLSAPRFHGDLAEAIMMMSPGDSMIAVVTVDSLKAASQRTQPWMQPGGKIFYALTLLSAKTQAEVNKERDASITVQMDKDDAILQKYFADNNIKAQKHSNGMYYVITKPGTGEKIKEGQKAFMNYSGRTLDGNVFDSNLDPKFNHVEPLSFPVGRSHVIRGWDEGVTLLNKGAKATFYIPSPLAYGPNSPTPAIPANSILIFDVELMDIR